MLTDHFATNLKLLRKQAGLTKSDLAEELWGPDVDSLGYTAARNRSLISSWESGMSVPCEENLDRLSEYFGVFVQDLAPDVPDPRPRPARTDSQGDGLVTVSVDASGRIEVTGAPADVAKMLKALQEEM